MKKGWREVWKASKKQLSLTKVERIRVKIEEERGSQIGMTTILVAQQC